MARTKKIIGLLLTMAILLTMIVIPASVNAATTEKTTDYQLADNVQDGVILHAWNWSYNTIKDNLQSIAQAGYTTIQTSPVQQPKIDQLSWWDVGGQWWKLYQPLSFSIAKTSWLGTKEELKSLCDEAHKYGIKIICDIVSNHMANDTEGTAGTYYDQIANFEPEIYNNTTEYFHQFKGMTSDSTIQNTVQGSLDGVPDLNTGSEYVQQRVISLLKECVDSGVDGFRFDAAKHIETPDDGAYASNYWPNVLGAATDYAKSTQSKDLYYYGEILNGVGTGRNISSYTKYMSVTDNESGNATRSYINSGSATNAASVAYKKADPANKLVVWAESHDTYTASSLSSANVSNENIVKTWALEASRLDATALYFARPGSALMGQVGDTTWKSITVSEINKFHNAFVGQSEKVSSSGTIAYVERGTSGVVLVNAGGYAKSVSVPATQMAAGTYTDAITGNTFTVSDGKITGDIGATGVAVVYNTTTSPYATVSSENGIFKGESLNVTINLVNATDGTYQINNGTPVSFTNSATVEVGKDAAYGSVVELKVTASNGTKTYENTYKYTKTEASHSGVFLYFDNTYSWENVFCYVYDETTDPDNTISNASWPGEQMTYDEATGYYIYEVPKELTNAQAQVIFNNNNNKQFPSKSGFDITNKSMIFKDGKWQEYVDASALFLGDADLDLSVNIKDATVIQKYSASLVTLSSAALTTADVNADKVVTIVDATLIQKYSAGIETGYKIGEKIGNEEQPTTPATAEPTTAPTQEGNLFYIADGTGWLFESGAKIWVYNNDTKEALETVKESPTDDSSKYCYLYLPEDWTNLSFYRTDYSVSDLDITDTETVFNTWKAGNYDGSTNGYFVSDNGKGSYKNYDPNGVSEMVPQTIYFDNSKTKWTSVYIYGWGNSGLANQCIEMTKVTDTVYSFTFDNEFEAGGQCFLFVSYDVSGNNWTGKPQTVNIAGEGGKNYFTNLTGSGTKWNGSWSTYNG